MAWVKLVPYTIYSEKILHYESRFNPYPWLIQA